MQSRVFSLFLSLCLLGVSATSHASSWYVSATRAKNLYQQGAIVLDTRPHKHWNKQHIKTSLPLSWTTFSPNKQHRKGTLLPLRHLNKRLSALGLRKNKAILVVGNGWHGWGEDGRIVWMSLIPFLFIETIIDFYSLTVVNQPRPRNGAIFTDFGGHAKEIDDASDTF